MILDLFPTFCVYRVSDVSIQLGAPLIVGVDPFGIQSFSAIVAKPGAKVILGITTATVRG